MIMSSIDSWHHLASINNYHIYENSMTKIKVVFIVIKKSEFDTLMKDKKTYLLKGQNMHFKFHSHIDEFRLRNN